MKITEKSHLDHGLTRAQVEYIMSRFRDRKTFFTETLDLSVVGLGTVPCALHGPIMDDRPIGEDDVVYLKREGREGTARLVDREPRMVTTLTVIAGPDGDELCVLYTAFGGPKAPKEVDDPAMTIDEIKESKAFWAEHALSKSVLLEPDIFEIFHGVTAAIQERLAYVESLKDDGLRKQFMERVRAGIVHLVSSLYGDEAAGAVELVAKVHGDDDKPKE